MAHQHIHPHELEDYPDHDHDHDHHHDHGHSHDHGHLHVHGGDNMQLAFFINLVFTIVEIFGGLFTNSLAILSDALHDTGDTVGLGLSWYFERLSKKGRTPTFSYGYRRFSILAALINATILFVGSIVIIVRAVPRIMH